MTVRLFLVGERLGPQLGRAGKRRTQQIIRAERRAAGDVVDYVEPRARRDIRAGGNFGPRWTNGFRGRVKETAGALIRVEFTMAVPYWRVFEFGATIRGRPLLWIPLSFAKDAQGKNARDYPGRLFRVDRKGGKAPLLMRAGRPAQAKYFGKPFVKIPKKFHLRQVIREGAQKIKDFYARRIKQEK